MHSLLTKDELDDELKAMEADMEEEQASVDEKELDLPSVPVRSLPGTVFPYI